MTSQELFVCFLSPRPWGSLDNKNIFFQHETTPNLLHEKTIKTQKHTQKRSVVGNVIWFKPTKEPRHKPPQCHCFFGPVKSMGLFGRKAKSSTTTKKTTKAVFAFFFSFFGFRLKKPLEAMGFGGVGVSGGNG